MVKEEELKEIEEHSEIKALKATGALLSPEGLVMLFLAGIIDLIGIFLLCFALDDFWITDIIAFIFIGTWMFIRMGHITTTKKAGKIAKKTGRKILKRLGLSTLVEIIPYLGGIAPCWTLAVFFELKNN